MFEKSNMDFNKLVTLQLIVLENFCRVLAKDKLEFQKVLYNETLSVFHVNLFERVQQ